MTVDYATPSKSYSNGKISLDKVDLPDAHIIHGREFPVAYTLNLQGNDYARDEVESFLAKLSKDGIFTQLIENHGTLVLRDSIPNSDDSKAEEIAAIIKTIEENRGQVEFEQNGTLTLRGKRGFNLYTASKSPPDFRLLQHNEYSRFKKYPNSLIFTILEYDAVGGETPLVHGGELYERVIKELPEFLKKLSTVGLKFDDEKWYKEPGVDNKIVWNHEVTFGRHIKPDDDYETQKSKAIALAKEYISDDAQWTGNDDLLISSITRPVKKFNDEPLLFSSIAAFADKYTTDKPKIKFGDGSLFDKADLEKYKEITSDLEYKHYWKSGDIVFVHNYQVSHGKSPYKEGGKRSTLVGMWDAKSEESKDQFKAYELKSVDSELSKLSIE